MAQNESRAAPVNASATEQLCSETQTVRQRVRCEIEILEKRAEADELSDSEMQHALESLHVQTGVVLKPEDYDEECQEGAAANTAAAATEHSEQTTTLPDEKQFIYSIVNAFLNKMTFHYPQAEELLEATLNHEMCLTPSVQLHVQEVFSAILSY